MSGINVLLALMIIVSFLVAIPLHEFGHALMARWLGDQSVMDRQTLSLRSHIDPVGVLMCVILAFQPVLAPPVGLGWGNPVKPDPWKMRVGPNAGVFIVALAGPLFSLLIGLATAGIAHFAAPFLVGNVFIVRVLQLLIVFASVNVALALFNLIPLYPLDGYQIVYTLLPSKQAMQFAKSAPYGMFAILALFFLLPFLANLAGVGNFPLFRLSYYIWLGAMNLISLVIGPLPLPAALPPDLFSLYLF
ncbi:MAG TPA: site-2 protease family protein [Ktedonobacteraceae bacterium]|nr:site-2 protease family protein [Ktedonobacteraceae bacterium]